MKVSTLLFLVFIGLPIAGMVATWIFLAVTATCYGIGRALGLIKEQEAGQ